MAGALRVRYGRARFRVSNDQEGFRRRNSGSPVLFGGVGLLRAASPCLDHATAASAVLPAAVLLPWSDGFSIAVEGLGCATRFGVSRRMCILGARFFSGCGWGGRSAARFCVSGRARFLTRSPGLVRRGVRCPTSRLVRSLLPGRLIVGAHAAR